MHYDVESVINMVTAPPGWRVVLNIASHKEMAPTYFIIQELIGWATVVDYYDEDNGRTQTSLSPVFLKEGAFPTTGLSFLRDGEGCVAEVLEPDEEPQSAPLATWTEYTEELEMQRVVERKSKGAQS